MYGKLALLIFFVLSLTLPGYASDYPWQLKSNQDGITVYTRTVEGSQLREFKAMMIVDAPITKIIPIFEDTHLVTAWYYQCVHAELLKDEGPQGKILYLVFQPPWPVSQRDSIFRRTKSIDQGTVSFTIEALPDYLPVNKGKVRVSMIHSHWRFTSLPGGKTEIYFQQHCNPGGSLPAFMVNALAVDTPINSLKALRNLIMK